MQSYSNAPSIKLTSIRRTLRAVLQLSVVTVPPSPNVSILISSGCGTRSTLPGAVRSSICLHRSNLCFRELIWDQKTLEQKALAYLPVYNSEK